MNLDMPPQTIDGLVARGTCAGDNLASIRRGARTRVADDDDLDPDIEANQWDRHRWIRFRMAIAGLSTVRRGLRARWTANDDDPTYRDLVGSIGPDAPEWQSYRSDWSGARAKALINELNRDDPVFEPTWILDGAPDSVAIGFGPDRGAGQVETTTTGAAEAHA
jgi:hypothetical protein